MSLDNITVGGVPLLEILRSEPVVSEVEKELRRQRSDLHRQINAHETTTSTPRPSGRSGTVHGFSAEVVAHANYLLHSGGSQAAKEYLDQQRGGNIMDEREVGGRNGTVEQAIAEAHVKENFYLAEARRATDEAARYRVVAQKLEEALGLITGPAPRSAAPTPGSPVRSNGGGSKIAWAKNITMILETTPHPLTRKELRAELAKLEPGASSSCVSNAVSYAFQHGPLSVNGSGHVVQLPDDAAGGP